MDDQETIHRRREIAAWKAVETLRTSPTRASVRFDAGWLRIWFSNVVKFSIGRCSMSAREEMSRKFGRLLVSLEDIKNEISPKLEIADQRRLSQLVSDLSISAYVIGSLQPADSLLKDLKKATPKKQRTGNAINARMKRRIAGGRDPLIDDIIRKHLGKREKEARSDVQAEMATQGLGSIQHSAFNVRWRRLQQEKIRSTSSPT